MNEAQWIAREFLAARRRDPEAFWSRFKRVRMVRWRTMHAWAALDGNEITGCVPWWVTCWRWLRRVVGRAGRD